MRQKTEIHCTTLFKVLNSY